MTWNTIATIELSQDWQFTPMIAPDFGYVRLTFGTAGIPVAVAQVNLDNGNFFDQRRIMATPHAQIFEFENPAVFVNRAIALRLPIPAAAFEVQIEVSSVPLFERSSSGTEIDFQPVMSGQTQILRRLNQPVTIDPTISSGIQEIVSGQSQQSAEFQQIDTALLQIIQRLEQPIIAQIDPAIPAAISALQVQQTKILQFMGRGQFNVLNYSLFNNAHYSYYDSTYTMLALRDGSLSSGMMANADRVFVQVQLAAAAYLNRVQIHPGQFNGGFNMPRNFRLYAGRVTTSNSAALLFESTIPSSNAVFDLAQVAALNTPDTEFTFEFFNSTQSAISILELQLFGQIA